MLLCSKVSFRAASSTCVAGLDKSGTKSFEIPQQIKAFDDKVSIVICMANTSLTICLMVQNGIFQSSNRLKPCPDLCLVGV